MPLDPSIPLSVKLPDIQTPQQAQAQALTLRNLAMQSQLDQARLEDYHAQAQDRQLVAAQRAREQAGTEALAASVKKHTTVDPDTGTPNVDYQAVAADLGAGGFNELATSWLKMQNENADSLDKLTTQRRAHAKEQLNTIGDLAYTAQSADDFKAAVALAAAHGLIDEPMARDTLGQVEQAGPDAWKAVATHFAQFSPKAQTAQAERQKPTTLAPGAVQVVDGQVVASNQQTLTPAQKASNDIAAARLAEEQRHNRATEAANNPFGAAGAVVGAPASGTSGAPATGPTGEAYLNTLAPDIAGEVKAYAEGRRPFPQGFALKSPYFQQLIRMVGQYDPTFDAVNYNARAKSRQDFTSGASAKQITALNTVIGHLADLDEKAGVLGNSSIQSYNAIKNWLKTQTGDASVTNFNTVKKGVTDELTRVWRQAGGSEQDIKTWAESLNAAQSPEQLTGAFSTIAGMLGSRLDALKNQRDQGLGPFGSDIAIITPRSQQALDKLHGSNAPIKVGGFTVTVKP